MRMLLKIKIPTEQGNRAIKDGSLGKILEATVSKLKAEAAYFIADDGCRCAHDLFRHEGFGRRFRPLSSLCSSGSGRSSSSSRS